MKMIVLAKAYGGRPLARVVLEIEGDRIYLAAPSRRHATNPQFAGAIGFPKSHVFKFDKRTYRRLKEAYLSNNINELNNIWDQIGRLDV